MCVALVVGNMIGTGVFQLPQSLAPLGWNSVYGWLATIGGTLCLAIVLVRLAKGRSDSCAPYAYPAAAFGPGTGFVVAWSYWISCWTANATLAIAVVRNLSPSGRSANPAVAVGGALAIRWAVHSSTAWGAEAGKVQGLTPLLSSFRWLAHRRRLGCRVGTASPALLRHSDVREHPDRRDLTLRDAQLRKRDGRRRPRRKPRRQRSAGAILGRCLPGLYLLCCSPVTLLLQPPGARSRSPLRLILSTLSPVAWTDRRRLRLDRRAWA